MPGLSFAYTKRTREIAAWFAYPLSCSRLKKA